MSKINYKITLSFISILASGVVLLSSCSKKDEQTPTDPEATQPIRPVTDQSKAYVTQLFSYNPAPGQFINTSVGNTEAAKSVLNGKNGLVSLGAFGGSIVFGFDHTVLNVDGKEDIVIYANAATGSAEPGVVWVMQDTNKNGLPDDSWFELAGAATNATGYVRNYQVTYTRPDPVTGDVKWKGSLKDSGLVKTNTFHKQPYYPESITAASYTLKGTLLPSTNIDANNPSFITSAPFNFGYADSTPGGDKVDIGNAIDDKGNKVKLNGIDFIKVQTGIQFNLGWLGELSTEVRGIADISLEKL
ncbi:cell surface protein [uncultured Mucilaginibacter sp.]|uniref:cell surface protein n=1 Tax=uncultured Mucilaginibacter sp. TaxID=797541 RepID=UPI0025CDADDA|nr:cell surface protein [uncultured Mucilaginibacter sp.]